MKKHILIATATFFALVLIFFWSTMFGGKTYLSADQQAASSLSAPLAEYQEKTGEMPLWSPYIFCGMPSFGSAMHTPYIYMPGVIFSAITPHFFSIHKLFSKLFPILHYVLAGLGVFLFLQHKGIGVFPAIFGGIAFMFTPYLIAMHAHGHGSQMMTAAYIPIALWATDRILERVSFLNIGLLGLILGFQLQRGHVQISYYLILFVGLYLIVHVLQSLLKKELKNTFAAIGGFIAAIFIAAGLSAVLYMPVQEYAPYSIRGAGSALTGNNGVGIDYATQFSFSPAEMLTFIVPSIFGFGGAMYWGHMTFTDFPNYMGILTLALAVAGIVMNAKRSPHQITVYFLGTIVLLSTILSVGGYFYRICYDFFPYWNRFRVPAMILILVQASVAILAGIGLASIITRLRDVNKKYLSYAILFIVAIVLALTIFRDNFFDFMAGYYPNRLDKRQVFAILHKDIWFTGFIAIAGLSLLLLAVSKKISPTVFAASICCLLVVDLWRVDKKIGHVFPEIKNANTTDTLIDFLKADTTLFRIYPAGQLFGELSWAAQGIESVGGYHAAKPRLYQDFLNAMPQPPLHILDMLNVKYIIALQNNELMVYKNESALPRAYFVGGYVVEPDPLSALTTMRTGFDFRHKVILSESPKLEPRLDSTANASLDKADYKLHRVRIKVSNQEPQILVLTDGYYPIGWQAYVDGRQTKTYQANYAFRAVCVPEHSKIVEFRYVSNAYNVGREMGYLALVIACCAMGTELLMKRK